ncbi:hypothetical protein [Noviherbaspirillum sp.]|uniref:hypothetical protein n=1 Tax=Noviherbaspirillum sp. TaxID=1926288 RepID=UPI0025E38F69|nr:hypothetical protein [Noviherbaspirillum sp.]
MLASLPFPIAEMERQACIAALFHEKRERECHNQRLEKLRWINYSMQKAILGGLTGSRAISFFAALTGVLGFMCSLALALQVLLAQGNPGFLIIWLLAMAATAASLRFDRKWRETFGRIHAMKPARTVHSAHRKWTRDAVDVVFRDIPSTSVAAGR